mgnify:CR=1 FL=1
MIDRPLTDYEKLRAEFVVALLPIISKEMPDFAEIKEYEKLDSVEQQDIWFWGRIAKKALAAADIILGELFREKS